MTVSIDLNRVRRNAEEIRRRTGVEMIAVVKADAYGLGAMEVAEAIGDLVDAFYVFDADEAVRARLWEITGKRTIALHSDWNDPQEFIDRHIHPVVWSVERARQLRSALPVLSVDTGQQRFACRGELAWEVCQAGDCREIMTHAVNLPQVEKLRQLVSSWGEEKFFLHAAGSALLDQPLAYLNAVRPGLALYQGAMRVTTRLVEVRDSTGPAGYSEFISPRFGIVLAGYSNGFRKGSCIINGQLRNVLEVGMQSAFVEIGPSDKAGDEVELLSDQPGADLTAVARCWSCSQQEVLVRFGRGGARRYARDGA